RAQGAGRGAKLAPAQGARGVEPRRSLAQDELAARRALRRRATARLHRARLRQPPAAPDLRRADREPRSRHVRRDHAAALPHQPLGHHDPDGHTRPRDGRQDAQARDRARGRPPRPRRASRRLHVRMSRIRLIFSEAFGSLASSLSTTFAAALTVLIAMFLLGVLVAFGTYTLSYAASKKRQLVVTVYLQDAATQQQKNVLANRFERDPLVKSWRY